MLRSVAISAGLLLVAHAAAAPAEGSGCGSAGEFARTRKVEDLPGCIAEPGRTAAADGALGEAKLALLRAQRAVAEEAAERVAPALQRAEEAVAALEAQGHEAAAQYRRALQVLGAQAQLLPDTDGLRACHAQAQVLLRTPAPQDLSAAHSQLTRTDECVALLRRLLSQKPIQEALEALSVEVAPGQPRRLGELLADVRAAQRAALAHRQAAQRGWEVVRARWLRVLFGDRLRVFNDHPDQLPEYDGKARGPLPASVVPRWRYRTPEGKVEIYRFQRNRLISRTVEDPRRS